MTDGMLELIRTRRVIRAMSDRPIPLQDLEKILEAGRWAPAGGNQRVVRFAAVRDPKTLEVLRQVSPGMLQRPAAVIVLCLDHEAIRANEISERDPVLFVDIGTTMQTMLLAAHALGIGSGPVTSFAHEAVRVVLNLPRELTPELMVCFGYAEKGARQPLMRGGGAPRITWQDLTHWERYPQSLQS